MAHLMHPRVDEVVFALSPGAAASPLKRGANPVGVDQSVERELDLVGLAKTRQSRLPAKLSGVHDLGPFTHDPPGHSGGEALPFGQRGMATYPLCHRLEVAVHT